MFRKFLFPSVGAVALLIGLGAPGQLQAQHMRGMRGSTPIRVLPSFRGGFDPRFHHGFDPRFRHDFDFRFDRGFFDPRFHHGPGPVRFHDPRFIPGFPPGFFFPF